MKLPRGVIDFGTCRLVVDGMYCETQFPDGTRATAQTGQRPDQIESAQRLGYPATDEGLAMMQWHHEALHSYLALLLYGTHSPVLWALAHGTVLDAGAARLEEARVCHVQAATRDTEAYVSVSEARLRAMLQGAADVLYGEQADPVYRT